MGTKTQLILYPIICDDQVNDQQISSIKPGNGQSPLIFMWKPPFKGDLELINVNQIRITRYSWVTPRKP